MQQLEGWLVITILVLARIGGCFVLLPGLASARVPVRVRLYLAAIISIAAAGPLQATLAPSAVQIDVLWLSAAIVAESATGVMIGLVVRVFFVALSFAATFMGNLVGLSTMQPSEIDEGGISTPLSDMIMLSATVTFFLLDMHMEVLQALIESYRTFPLGQMPDSGWALQRIVDATTAAFLVALGFAAPFVVYAIVANLLLGIANRLIPQISIQFVAAPLVLNGGLIIMFLMTAAMLRVFSDGFASWLERV